MPVIQGFVRGWCEEQESQLAPRATALVYLLMCNPLSLVLPRTVNVTECHREILLGERDLIGALFKRCHGEGSFVLMASLTALLELLTNAAPGVGELEHCSCPGAQAA